MPPNVAIWYSDKARPTTQRGVDSWTVTLNSASVSTQLAPPIISPRHVSQALVLSPDMVAEIAKLRKPIRAIHSLGRTPRSLPLSTAPLIAPTP